MHRSYCRSRRHRFVCVALIACTLPLKGEIAASEPTGQSINFVQSPHASLPDSAEESPTTSDCDSERLSRFLRAAFCGDGSISAEHVYTGNVFTNVRGGLDTSRATKYLGNYGLTLTADLDRMNFFAGGQFVLYAQSTHGRGLTNDYVGDLQSLNNADAFEPFTQVSEFWWERWIVEDELRVTLGKQDANVEFAVLEPAAHFINSSFGFHPNIPMPTFPMPSMAAVVEWNIDEQWVFEYGVWDGRPELGNWGFSESGKLFHIWELEYHYALGRDGRLPGTVHVGPWYHSDRFDDLSPGSGRVHAGNYGIHGEWAQRLFNEDGRDEENTQGLDAFLQYGWAPADRNEIEHYLGGGLVYQGPLYSRDDDVVGIAFAHVILSDRLPGQNYETAVELFYKAQLSPRLMVQSDVQFIANPGGNGRDAIVAGVRVELVL